MTILSLFSWWYTTGWLTLARRLSERIKSVLGFFSVPLLITSFFAPFRQISAGRVQGPLQAQLQAFGDRVFSRFMGAIIRFFLIIIGLVCVVVVGAVALLMVVAWPLLPVAPLIGLMLTGVAV